MKKIDLLTLNEEELHKLIRDAEELLIKKQVKELVFKVRLSVESYESRPDDASSPEFLADHVFDAVDIYMKKTFVRKNEKVVVLGVDI